MLQLEPIERRVMRMLLAGDHPTLDILRKQFSRSHVSEREFTGKGFFTSFEVRDCLPRLRERKRIVIHDVCADVDGLESFCGFVLFVNDGLLHTLECFVWDSARLPSHARYTRVYYVRQPAVTETKHRDMEALNAVLDR